MTPAQKLALARAAFRVAEANARYAVAARARDYGRLDDVELGRVSRVASAAIGAATNEIDAYMKIRRDCGLPEIKP